MSIRLARPSDAAALSVLLTELGHPADAHVVARRLEALPAGEEVLVAEDEGTNEVVGLMTVHVTPVLHRPTPVGRVTALVVASRFRGRGIGRDLVSAAERRLAERGCALMEVTSNLSRTDAHAFYRQIGFESTSYRFMKLLSPAS